jgi:hypothetical protein
MNRNRIVEDRVEQEVYQQEQEKTLERDWRKSLRQLVEREENEVRKKAPRHLTWNKKKENVT